MTPRSLVGMTMGARKRAVQCWMECERLHQKCQDLLESIDRAARRAPRPRTIGHTPARLKEHYRIGQRLRPCPGCSNCIGPNYPCHMRCDGSGVLPARAKKVRR